MPDPLAVANLAEAALAAVLAALASTPGGVPKRQFLADGLVAWDDPCDGMCWVRLIRLYPSWRFPIPDNLLQPCPIRVAAELECGVLRCAPGMHEGASPFPTPEELNASAVVLLADAQAVMAALLAFIANTLDGDGLIASVSPVGPEGQGVGTLAVFTLDVTAACWSG